MDRIGQAVRSNAHLCKTMCAAHGCRTQSSGVLLRCLDAPPRYYPHAVTLSPGSGPIVRKSVAGTFKDSFCDVEPDPKRYFKLFEADWIWKESVGTAPSFTLQWSRIKTDADLRLWEKGWSEGDTESANFPRQFPTSLLDRTDVLFYGAWKNAELLAGVLVNCTPSVVGFSNVFATGCDEALLWEELAALAGAEFPDLCVTGYEQGTALESAIRAGFEAIGSLRVWRPLAL